jgi:hypothetical protein
LCTAFRSASIKYFTSALGCHSCTKTVSSYTFNFTWLVCSFHFTYGLIGWALTKTDKKDNGW